MSFIKDHPYLTGFLACKIMNDAENASKKLQEEYDVTNTTAIDETKYLTEKSSQQYSSITSDNSDSKPFFFPFYLGLITGIALCCLLPIVEIIKFIISL